MQYRRASGRDQSDDYLGQNRESRLTNGPRPERVKNVSAVTFMIYISSEQFVCEYSHLGNVAVEPFFFFSVLQ